MWQGRRVVLGVTGGIAAYKSVLLARALTERGAKVDVVLTRGARNFVGPVTFEAVTHRPVRGSLWDRDGALDHVTMGRDAELILVAPATSHLLARAAVGMADDLLTALLLAATAPIVIAPAMNDEMFANPATQANLGVLRARGWIVLGPVAGPLAEGPSDRVGRMMEPELLLANAERVLHHNGPLSGRRVVVTAGPTREPIDPVRVISNRSSGKMGYHLAEATWRRGAEVTLISGPTTLVPPAGVTLVRVETTKEMAEAVVGAIAQADILLMAAAPADFRPATASETKKPRVKGGLTLELVPTDDILQSTFAQRPPAITVVGFALETGDAVKKGREKLRDKALDLIVINDALQPGAGFDVDTNIVTILDRQGREESVTLRSKAAVAEAILDAVERYRA